MKTIRNFTILLFSLLFLVSCDNGFETMNQDPNNPRAVPSSLLITGIVRGAQNESYSTFTGGDMGACWSQHFSKVQYNDEERYQPRQGVITRVWDTYYTVVIADALAMQKIATEEGNKNMQGVALTLQAYGFAFLTDLYGDIPFSEALKTEQGIIAPKYDKQADVYTGVLKMLDDAIALLGTSGTIDATNDILYQGNAQNWKKFATSLKFRVLMRASKKLESTPTFKTQLQALVNSGNLFQSNAQEAKLIYLSANPSANPLYESIVFGTRGEWKINAKMVEILVLNSDPRLPIYAQKNAAGAYRGKPAGIVNVPSDDYNYTNVSALGTFYLKPELPAFFISHSELKFLMAEAVVKGYITGNAETFFQDGIRSNLEFNGVASADVTTYLAQKGVLAVAQTAALTQIYTQNWIGLFSQGVESWTEWRRTKTPALLPALEADLTEIPSRYNYPTTESSINKANYDAAVAAQGADKLTTPIWWMQ